MNQMLSVNGEQIPSEQHYNKQFAGEQQKKDMNTILSSHGIEHLKYVLTFLAKKHKPKKLFDDYGKSIPSADTTMVIYN
jgi:hypothetical protein